jgi:hypothetical protein
MVPGDVSRGREVRVNQWWSFEVGEALVMWCLVAVDLCGYMSKEDMRVTFIKRSMLLFICWGT